MTKDEIRQLVQVVLAQNSKIHFPDNVELNLSLKELGFDETDINDLKTKFYRTLSGDKPLNFSGFTSKLKFNANSSVRSVVNAVLAVTNLPSATQIGLKI